MAIEQKSRLGERESRGTEGVQAVDGGLLLRSDIKPVDRRSKDDHVGIFQRLDHVGHVILLHADALMGEAVLASQAAGDLLAGNADDLDRIVALTRGLGKRLNHGVGIGALARAAAQYNDFHRIPSPSCRRRAACFLVTKTNGAIQSSVDRISRSCPPKKVQAEASRALISADMDHDMKP